MMEQSLRRQVTGQPLTCQGGAVLLFALIILLALTILGFSNSQSVLMQEKMAFAAQDGHVALQSAELGMRSAEAFIETHDSSTLSGAGIYPQGHGPDDIYAAANWSAANTMVADTSVHSDVAAPRFYLEELGRRSGVGSNSSLNITGYGSKPMTGAVTIFRIVARGTGRSAMTERLLVGYYGKRL